MTFPCPVMRCAPRSFRTSIWSPHCRADELARFLAGLRCQRLYLVGDIVDLWWLASHRAHWGAAHTGEGPDAPRLKALAQGLGLGTNVLFLGNLVRPGALLDCYRAADLFV